MQLCIMNWQSTNEFKLQLRSSGQNWGKRFLEKNLMHGCQNYSLAHNEYRQALPSRNIVPELIAIK